MNTLDRFKETVKNVSTIDAGPWIIGVAIIMFGQMVSAAIKNHRVNSTQYHYPEDM